MHISGSSRPFLKISRYFTKIGNRNALKPYFMCFHAFSYKNRGISRMAKKKIEDITEDYKIEDKDSGLDMFKTMQEDKEQSIKEMIKDITTQISSREDLHKEMMNDFKSVKLDIDNFLGQIPKPADERATAEMIKAMGELRNEQIKVAELQVAEKLNFWRDVATLKKELREHEAELREREKKTDILDSIL